MKEHVTYFWFAFILGNVALTLMFAIVRMPIMDKNHFDVSGDRDLGWFKDSIYISVMHQSTIGDSSIVPKTTGAIIISVLQAFGIFVVYGFALWFLMKFA